MANSQVGTLTATALVLAAWCTPVEAQLTRQSGPTQRQPSGPLSTHTPAPTLVPLPSVTVEGSLYPGSRIVLRTRNAGATANGRRVKLVRVSDGKAQYLDIVSWREGEVVATVPSQPFDGPASAGELLIGLCATNGGWSGIPARTAFAPNNAPRVGLRATGCANPDWDGDGADSPECGGTDCNDGDGRRTPGGVEICDRDNIDEDCDITTHGVRDADGDGSSDIACCNVDSSGGRICGDDCDDHRAGVHRTAPEVCDRYDNDCDTGIDEGVTQVLWIDRDGDGFGDPNAVQMACGWGNGLSHIGNDCNDSDPNVYKGHGCD